MSVRTRTWIPTNTALGTSNFTLFITRRTIELTDGVIKKPTNKYTATHGNNYQQQTTAARLAADWNADVTGSRKIHSSVVRIDKCKHYHSLFDQEEQVMEYARHIHRNSMGGGLWAHKILVTISSDSLTNMQRTNKKIRWPAMFQNRVNELITYSVWKHILTLYLTCVSKQDSEKNPIECDNLTSHS